MLELPEASRVRRARAGRRSKLAPGYVTALLGLEPGTKAFLRQLLLGDDEGPVELASMWLPIELASGTSLASPTCWTRASATICRPARRSVSITPWSGSGPPARLREEAGLLQVAADAPVLNVIVTAYDADGRPAAGGRPRATRRHGTRLHDAYPFT